MSSPASTIWDLRDIHKAKSGAAGAQFPRATYDIEILAVGAGGGGGDGAFGGAGGGGGGGGVAYFSMGTLSVIRNCSYCVTIGAGGGSGGQSGGSRGANTTICGCFQGRGTCTILALGGGGGSGPWPNAQDKNSIPLNGGASGGGGNTPATFFNCALQPAVDTGFGIPGCGFGCPGGAACCSSAGGGGARCSGCPGKPSPTTPSPAYLGGNGGDGLTYTVSGAPLAYAGGGGGSGANSGLPSWPTDRCRGGVGGAGGGGPGGPGPLGDPFSVTCNFNPNPDAATNGAPGLANRGGGAGGGSGGGPVNAQGGTGGSGVVIFRYIGGPRATGGSSCCYDGSNTSHIFCATGSFIA